LSTVVKGAIHDFIKHDLENSTCDLEQVRNDLLSKIKTSVDIYKQSTPRKGGAYTFNRRCTRLRPKNWVFTNKCCDMQKEFKKNYSGFEITVPNDYTNEECVDMLTTFKNSQETHYYDCKIFKRILKKLIQSNDFQQTVASLKDDGTSETKIESIIYKLVYEASDQTNEYEMGLRVRLPEVIKAKAKNTKAPAYQVNANDDEEYETDVNPISGKSKTAFY